MMYYVACECYLVQIRVRLKRRLQARVFNSERASEVKKSSLANKSAVEEQPRDTYELRE